MGTNSAPLFADLFFHTFEYDFMVTTMKKKPSNSATPFGTSTIYSVLTMWTLEITSAQFTRRNWNLRTLPSSTEVCYLDTETHKGLNPYGFLLDINIKTGDNTPFRISIYDKREDFAFRIVNFPHMAVSYTHLTLPTIYSV